MFKPTLNLKSTSNIALDTLKIKETFSYLQNKKIDQVQKLISENTNKLKPWINMTMKGLLRKQVIVSMNNDVAKRYIKDSSMHVININCTLKNIKSTIIMDFIHSNDKGIVIATNGVASPLDL